MRYMGLSKPVIVLAYGNLASCVALTSFTDFSDKFLAKAGEDVNADGDPNWFAALVGTSQNNQRTARYKLTIGRNEIE
jgi:hypothetical protein